MSYVSKSDLPEGIKVNDYIVGVSHVYRVYSDMGSSCILRTIQDITIETSNIGKTNMNPSSEDWSMGYINISTIKMRGDVPVKVGDIIVNTNNQKAYKAMEVGSSAVRRESDFEYDIGTF